MKDHGPCAQSRQPLSPGALKPMSHAHMSELIEREITETEARLMEAYGPLEMARIIEAMSAELAWIEAFATVRSQDESKVFARVNRGALRTIADRARTTLSTAKGADHA